MSSLAGQGHDSFAPDRKYFRYVIRFSVTIAVPLLVVTLLCRCATPEQRSIEKSRPNILIIVADDVSPLHFETYGGLVPTPSINPLAEDGLTFQNAYSNSSACTPSRFSLLTGLYAGRNRSQEFLTANPLRARYNVQCDTPVIPENVTLHEMMREAGYFTGYVGKFQPFVHHPTRASILERINNAGLPYDHYTAGAVYLDDQVQATINKLEEMGLSENTLVIFTADHGTEPGKSTCYEKGVQVPFIVKWPNMILPGSKSQERIQLVDLFPTWASIANQPEATADGVSIVPTFYGGELDRSFLYFEGGYQRAVSTDSLKYIATRFPESAIDFDDLEFINHFNVPRQIHAAIAARYHPGYFDADQLYHLASDPYEQNNLATNSVYDGKLEELQHLLSSVLNTFDHPYELDQIELFQTGEYATVVNNTKALGTDYISWWRDDFLWPPASTAGQEIQD